MDAKKARKKLVLNKETLRTLEERDLETVVGGMRPTSPEPHPFQGVGSIPLPGACRAPREPTPAVLCVP